MSRFCKTISSECPTVHFDCRICVCSTVGIFTYYCSTVSGHYILLQSSLFQYFLLQRYDVVSSVV